MTMVDYLRAVQRSSCCTPRPVPNAGMDGHNAHTILRTNRSWSEGLSILPLPSSEPGFRSAVRFWHIPGSEFRRYLGRQSDS